MQLLAAKAAKTPTLILLDNVQWMDAQSWELLIRVKHEVPSETPPRHFPDIAHPRQARGPFLDTS